MGNQLCTATSNYCGPTQTVQQEPQYTIQVMESPKPIHLPELSSSVAAVLSEKTDFLIDFHQREFNIKRRIFGDDIYEGELNSNELPEGIGKMYKIDGSLFIGTFHKGKAQGKGLYIMNNGSYFKGNLIDNIADCQNGKFVCKEFTYEGGFKDNMFHGEGKEQSNSHTFTGSYVNSIKTFGELKWWNVPGKENQYCYYGKFDECGRFVDEAVLIEPTGKYTGNFTKGKKHGQGVYLYKNNLKYQGDYKNGMKDGHGIVSYIDKNVVIYDGEWRNNLPDGEGIKYDEAGKQIKTYFKEGINILALRDSQSYDFR